VKELILDKRISLSDKINALKCKIAYLLETDFLGLLLLLIGCGRIGASGLFVILDTLRKLFNERKLSRAFYEELKNVYYLGKAITKDLSSFRNDTKLSSIF
jgi:hypothetical protein